MKGIITWLAGILALFITYSSVAQQKTGDGKSLLWSIYGKQLAKPSYLFGTIHMICIQDYVWTNQMKESLDKCDKVCFEMDMDDPAVMMQVAGGLVDFNGKKLKDYFTAEQYKLLSSYIKDSLRLDISL